MFFITTLFAQETIFINHSNYSDHEVSIGTECISRYVPGFDEKILGYWEGRTYFNIEVFYGNSNSIILTGSDSAISRKEALDAVTSCNEQETDQFVVFPVWREPLMEC